MQNNEVTKKCNGVDAEGEDSARAVEMVDVRVQACFAGYLYIRAFIGLAGAHTSVCFMRLLL